MVMFPEFVVVWVADTVTVGLEMVMFPAALVVAETVAVPAVFEIATRPREVTGAALVIPVEAVSLTVPALMVPVPVVFTVEAALVIETSCNAARFEVPLV